ncbi:MAG TPA: hypothetical protein DEO82_00935 [Eubacterium sp.]|nr:hypothetical protein [Eubacterium sp.]
MISIDNLKNYGANTEEALVRCMNREDFYLMLVGKVLADERLITLEEKLTDKDYDAAFEIAHALKGMYSNLSLTPLAKPIIKMTELLRAKTDTDYSALLAEAKSQFEALKSL